MMTSNVLLLAAALGANAAPAAEKTSPPTEAPSPSTPTQPAASRPAPNQPAATPAPAEGSTTAPLLHLDEAIRQALAAQPNLRQAQAQALAAEARAAQARAGLLPQVKAQAAYERATANALARAGSVPGQLGSGTSSSWDTFNYYSANITASQLVYDFGGTLDRYRSAQASATAQGDAESTVRLSTVLAVRSAFFNARGARALLRVAEDTFANQRRHLDQIQGFVEVGTRPQIDLVQARADLANAEVQRINADNSYRTAKAQLNQAMGREGPADFEVADDTLPEVPGESEAPQVLLDEALSSRPELGQINSQVRAEELLVKGISGDYWPSFGVDTGATFGGTKLGDLGWNWTAQATLTWPIFEGGLTRAQVAEASATVTALQAQRDGVRQQVGLQVEQARLAVGAAKAALVASEQALQNANERLALAEARYQTGVGSIIELGDAQVARTNAAGQRVQAEYSLATARAQLLEALGRPYGG